MSFKGREIFCLYRPHIGLAEFLSHLQYLRPKSILLIDIPLKGKTEGFFRPVERTMQHLGLPCRPSKKALMKGKRLLLKIKALGFNAIEIYPYEFYKFYNLLPRDNSDPASEICIDQAVFKKFFPPYKRAGKKGLKNAEKIIKQLLAFLKLKLVIDRELKFKNQGVNWDIYDSIFGVIAGYLLLKNSPWIKFVRDKTGSEILLLSDVNMGHFLDAHTEETE